MWDRERWDTTCAKLMIIFVMAPHRFMWMDKGMGCSVCWVISVICVIIVIIIIQRMDNIQAHITNHHDKLEYCLGMQEWCL